MRMEYCQIWLRMLFFLWLCGVHLDHDLCGVMENDPCGWSILQCY
jgi:hypothetical protein